MLVWTHGQGRNRGAAVQGTCLGIEVYGPMRNWQQGTGRGTPIDVHGCGAARLVHPDLAMGKCSQGHGTDMGAGSVTEVSAHRQKLVV